MKDKISFDFIVSIFLLILLAVTAINVTKNFTQVIIQFIIQFKVKLNKFINLLILVAHHLPDLPVLVEKLASVIALSLLQIIQYLSAQFFLVIRMV